MVYKNKAPKKILVIKTEGGVGDLLMATPLLSTLRHHYPESRIEVMVKPSFAEILLCNPYINEVIPLQSKEKSLLWIVGFLHARRYDMGILLWGTSKLAWSMFFAGISSRIGEDKRFAYSWLFTDKVARRLYLEGRDESHQVEQMLDYGRILGLEPQHNGLVLSLEHDAGREAKKRIKLLLQDTFLKQGERLVGLHIGKGMELHSKGWPIKNFAELADCITERFHAKVVLTGGEYEVPMVEELVTMVKHPVINMAGKTTLLELAALISQCNLFICPDSGPAHIAAAMKVPTVSIFALKSDFPSRWRPFGTDYEIVRKVTECGRVCIKETCHDFVCMRQITPSDILPAVERLLSKCESVST